VSERQKVAVVTGGGGGIGAAVAEELGRDGWFVVTLDPLVTLDGSERLRDQDETTAGRIVAAGGSAKASSASVTDREGVRNLFDEIVNEHGGLDAVVNVAGITRQTFFGKGTEPDWLAVLDVHLGGYLNILNAALPIMAEAGRGTILGVTSGSGWRAADAGAYSCAKRAVASLTWQIGRAAPQGVTVNAMSPIAATRMVAAALERARQAGRTSGGGMSFLGMPEPEEIGPFGAYLVSEQFGWSTGHVLFAGGSEVAVVDEPRLMEVVRTEGVTSLSHALDTFIPRAFTASEEKQSTSGGGNARFGPIFDEAITTEATLSDIGSCLVVTDRPRMGAAVAASLEARSIACHQIAVAKGFEGARAALGSAPGTDAIVVAPSGPSHTGAPDGWERMLDEHTGIIDGIHTDAAWARAAADAGRPVRLITLTDAVDAGGRSRAQAAAQHARVAAGATEGRVTAFSASIEASEERSAEPTAELVGHLLSHPEALKLAGAELVVGNGWLGLRSHPRPTGSVTFGGPAIPEWLDGTLREIAVAAERNQDPWT
jgi:NAD(P)-dependent dehydrogenase (short-subunit alcohol dehydrogenase family)